MPKEKEIWYWVPRAIGLITLLGMIASASVRIHNVEEKASRVRIVEWDIALIKGFARALKPNLYDSVLNVQLHEYGPRPMEE